MPESDPKLEVKEGILLDQDGTPVETRGARAPKAADWGIAWPVGVALAIVVPLLLMAGFALFTILSVLILAFVVVRGVLALLGLGGARKRLDSRRGVHLRYTVIRRGR